VKTRRRHHEKKRDSNMKRHYPAVTILPGRAPHEVEVCQWEEVPRVDRVVKAHGSERAFNTFCQETTKGRASAYFILFQYLFDVYLRNFQEFLFGVVFLVYLEMRWVLYVFFLEIFGHRGEAVIEAGKLEVC